MLNYKGICMASENALAPRPMKPMLRDRAEASKSRSETRIATAI
jgi:hypothetical protein